MWWLSPLLALVLWQSPDVAAEGMKALDEQRWDAAAGAFSKAIEADPKEFSHHFHLGLALGMLGRDAEAIAEYQKALELKPDVPQARMNLGILLIRAKRNAEALPHFEAVAKARPNDLRAHVYLGEALLGAGEPARGEAVFSTALQLDSKSAAAELGLGRALARQGKLGESAPHFAKAAELDPAYGDAVLELAELYEKAKQLPEAIAIYEKFPDNPGARERLGEALLESSKAAEAIPHLEAAVAQSPTPAKQYALATAYVLDKKPAMAEPLLAKAVAAEPGNTDLRMMYARTLREQRKFSAAAAEFYKVAQAKPDHATAWSDLAGMLVLTENDEAALAALEKVRALGAEIAAHHYFRAIILDRHQQYKPALESYEKFLAMSEGKNPDEEFKARQRIRIIQKELRR